MQAGAATGEHDRGSVAQRAIFRSVRLASHRLVVIDAASTSSRPAGFKLPLAARPRMSSSQPRASTSRIVPSLAQPQGGPAASPPETHDDDRCHEQGHQQQGAFRPCGATAAANSSTFHPARSPEPRRKSI